MYSFYAYVQVKTFYVCKKKATGHQKENMGAFCCAVTIALFFCEHEVCVQLTFIQI